SPNQAQTVINNLIQGTYRFELRVTDNSGAFGRDTMTVTVNAAPPPNQAPAANAGPDHVLTLPANSLTASGSGTDPDGTIVSYQWNKIAGPAQFVIISPALAQTVINNLVQGVYRFELVVTDNNGATGRDTMTVTVNAAPPPNQAPAANAGPDQTITLPVNTVTVNGSGTDPDGTITAYLWTKISGPASYTIASPASATTVINNLIQGTYQFELRVTDNNGAFGRDTMIVTVNAAPPPPPNQAPTANAGPDTTITLPVNTVIIAGSGSDPDGTIVSYQWNKISGPAAYTIVFPNQAQTAFADLVDGVYLFELVVTDNNGATARDTMQVTVLQNPARISTARIYPNPATSVINIQIDAITYSNKTLIRIFNVAGIPVYQTEVMRTQQNTTVTIDVSKFPAGSYFVNISVDINNAITLP
ncbi:MAG TPA: PKD domain-containing protein, partial [Gemmatimonadales bacterium]|nr:PKD domain-containing protein [Gemmatimonadales bacterium]